MIECSRNNVYWKATWSETFWSISDFYKKRQNLNFRPLKASSPSDSTSVVAVNSTRATPSSIWTRSAIFVMLSPRTERPSMDVPCLWVINEIIRVTKWDNRGNLDLRKRPEQESRLQVRSGPGEEQAVREERAHRRYGGSVKSETDIFKLESSQNCDFFSGSLHPVRFSQIGENCNFQVR